MNFWDFPVFPDFSSTSRDHNCFSYNMNLVIEIPILSGGDSGNESVPLNIYLGSGGSKCAEMEVLWWPDFLKFISDFLTPQIFFWSSRLFAPWLKTMIFQRSSMKFTKEFNSWNSRSNFQSALKKNRQYFFLIFFYMKGIPLYFHFRTSRASGADLYDRRCRYNSAIPPPSGWIS